MNFLLIKIIAAVFVVLAVFVVFCYKDLKKDKEDHKRLFND